MLAFRGESGSWFRGDGRRVRRVAQLLVVLWIFGMADLYFTVWASRYATPRPANPFPVAGAVLGNGPVAGVVVLKLGLMAVGSGAFWSLRRFARAETGLWLIVLAYVLLTFYWADYTTAISSLVAWDT
jgi:hypothetical protein